MDGVSAAPLIISMGVWSHRPAAPAALPLLWLLLQLLCPCTGAQDGTMCDTEVLVRRHTVLKAAPMKSLTINCTIRWKGCTEDPPVIWCKLHGSTCVKVNRTRHVTISQEKTAENELIHYLKFHGVTKHDGGLYRCEIFGSATIVSHAINISVSETLHTTTASPAKSDSDQDWLLYVCVFAVCVVVILIAIIICLCTLRAGHHVTGHCLCTEILLSHSQVV